MTTLRGLVTKALSPTLQTRRNEQARDRYHAKRLAAEKGYKLETGRDSSGWYCWIDGTDWDDDRFCTSWSEVRSKLTD